MIRPSRISRDGGFTLAETLVALAVIGLMAMLLFEGLRLGGKVWTGLSARAAAIDEISTARRLTRTLLDQAYPLPAPTAQGFRVDFRGEATGVAFWTPPPEIWPNPGGIIQARLRIETQEGRRNLVLTLSEDFSDPAKSEAFVLLRNVEGATLEYFGSSGGWSASWIDHATLPSLVRLVVTFPSGDQRHWPELVVAPKIELDTECVADPLTQRCRGR